MSVLDPVRMAGFLHENQLGCRPPTRHRPRCTIAWHALEATRLTNVLTAAHRPPDCDNCHHPYGEHNGRSLGWSTRAGPQGMGVGPPDRNAWGSSCSHLMDSRHTCPCGTWMITYRGLRLTQRMLEAVAA